MLRRWLHSKNGWPVMTGLACMAAVAILQLTGSPLFERVGLQVFDAYQRSAPRALSEAPVVVVEIDEESIARLGQWPWPRTELARLNRILGQAGATVIAYDIVFSEADRTSPARVAERLARSGAAPDVSERLAGLPDNDQIFADSMGATPVVNGLFLLSEDRGRPIEPKAGFALLGSLPDRSMRDLPGAIQALPVLEDHAAGAGSLSLPGDADGIVRRIPLVALHRGQLVPSLSLETLRISRGDETIVVKTSDGSGETASAPGSVVSVRVGDAEIPTTDAGEMWVYFRPGMADRTIPAWRLLEGALSPQEIADRVGGKIVFVGASATGLRDLIATPLADREPGVMVHAQATEQMLERAFLQRPDWAPGLELFLVLLLGGGLALLLPRLGAVAGGVIGLIAIAAVGAASWFAFTEASYLLDPTYPALAVAVVYVIQTAIVFYREERQRAYIHRAFDRYLSPEMVRQIAADPSKLELGGEEREMTVLMCDIRGFSRISERHAPNEVIDFLIAFLTPMSDILLESRATLDKFIGDAILAFWNAPLDNPDHFRDGARAALAMVAKLAELNRDMPAKSDQIWPGQVEIGIGINSGPCCVGNMGSRQRLSYSLIGDTVNMAARLEGLTKQYRVPIVVGSSLAGHLPDFALLELDRVRVVGRDTPETIFALLGDETLASSADYRSLAAGQAEFLRAYRETDWEAAEELLQALAGLHAAHGLDGLAETYRARVAALRANPPSPNWDGVFQAAEK